MTKLNTALGIALMLFYGVCSAEVLLSDDFSEPALDKSLWYVPAGEGTYFGRTQIRPPSETPTIVDGRLRLRLDTFNPSALLPGDSFFGSEIRSLQTFSPNHGEEIVFEARACLFCTSLEPSSTGMIGGLFLFGLNGDIRDEIDIELLSNDIGHGRVFTNSFDDDDFSHPGDNSHVSVSGLALNVMNDYQIRWRRNRISWHVNGDLIREETDTVPDAPMEARANIWVSDLFFVESYDVALQPVANGRENATYFLDIDSIAVASHRIIDCDMNGVVNVADLTCSNMEDATDELLTELKLIRGDINGNGTVDFSDFLILSSNFGEGLSGYNEGDLDASQNVDFSDFLILSSNFGESADQAVTVPEPLCATWLTVVFAAAAYRMSVHGQRAGS